MQNKNVHRGRVRQRRRVVCSGMLLALLTKRLAKLDLVDLIRDSKKVRNDPR